MRDYSRQFCALEWAEYVGRTECAHMIAHFMLDLSSNKSNNLQKKNSRNNGERISGKKRNGSTKNSPQQHYKFKYSSNAAAAALAASTTILLPMKKISGTACNNFKQVNFFSQKKNKTFTILVDLSIIKILIKIISNTCVKCLIS